MLKYGTLLFADKIKANGKVLVRCNRCSNFFRSEFLQISFKASRDVSSMAVDGISIRAVTINKFIRESIASKGHKFPSYETEVKYLI